MRISNSSAILLKISFLLFFFIFIMRNATEINAMPLLGEVAQAVTQEKQAIPAVIQSNSNNNQNAAIPQIIAQPINNQAVMTTPQQLTTDTNAMPVIATISPPQVTTANNNQATTITSGNPTAAIEIMPEQVVNPTTVTLSPQAVANPVAPINAQTNTVAAQVTVPSNSLQESSSDLRSRIKQLYSSMQNTQQQTINATTYTSVGSSLVRVFNEAIEIHSYLIQLLNAAAATPLLNGEQQKYVRETMIPRLNQIDAQTKPISSENKSENKSALQAGTFSTEKTSQQTKKKKNAKKSKKRATTSKAAKEANSDEKQHKKVKKTVAQQAGSSKQQARQKNTPNTHKTTKTPKNQHKKKKQPKNGAVVAINP